MVNVCRIGFGDVAKDDEKKIMEILKMKTIAVIGVSPKPDRPSNYVPKYMQEKGYKVVPIRPGLKEILGERCYRSLDEVREPIELVNVFRRSEFCPQIAKQAVNIGAKAIWLQEGVISQEAKEIAEKHNLLVIMDLCLKKAYEKYIEHSRYI